MVEGGARRMGGRDVDDVLLPRHTDSPRRQRDSRKAGGYKPIAATMAAMTRSSATSGNPTDFANAQKSPSPSLTRSNGSATGTWLYRELCRE